MKLSRNASGRAITRLVVAACGLALAASLSPLVPSVGERTPTAAASTLPELVFSGVVRSNNLEAIFTANTDGSELRKISPNDGRHHAWPRFAFGNTKIVYTSRSGPIGGPEDLNIMDVDGSDSQVLRHFPYRIFQPIVEPGGRWVMFSARPPFFSSVVQFKMDLATMTVTNITAVGRPSGGAFDADPHLTNNGAQLIFTENTPGRGTTITKMDSDGTDRSAITTTAYFHTDPGVSYDGRKIAIASYRGYGKPPQGPPGTVIGGVPPEYFYIAVQAPTRGAPEVVLNNGRNCLIRTPEDPCTVKDMSGWIPRFTPDNGTVAFIGALDNRRTCICAIDVDGSDPRTFIVSPDVALSWLDFPQPAGYSTDTDHIGANERDSKLLVVYTDADKVRRLAIAEPDLAIRTVIPLPDDLQPLMASWGPEQDSIVFSAKVPVGSTKPPHPAPPVGETRRVHPTHANPRRLAASVAEQQVFVLDTSDNSVRQLTDPWIEDWRDGLQSGDKRANSQPKVSPDGRYVVVRNTSTLTGESFLLRIDLQTDEVVSLTAASPEIVPSDDAHPNFTADGQRLAFTRYSGTKRAVYSMNPHFGGSVVQLRLDSYHASLPAWSPNKKLLYYVSARPDGTQVLRSTIEINGVGGTPKTFSGRAFGPTAPVAAPEGDLVAFLHRGRVYVRRPTGSAGPRQLQPDLVNTFATIDWGKA